MSLQLVPLKVPGFLTAALTPPTPAANPGSQPETAPSSQPARPEQRVEYAGGPVEFERVVPPSGNLQVAGKQFWLGSARAGVTVTSWADTDIIHLLVAGARLKSLRSHLSVTDLATLARQGGRPAGPSPLPTDATGRPGTLEVDRTVNRCGHVSIGQHIILAAEILAGRRVGIRIEAHTLTFFDLETRQLLRARPNPLTAQEVVRLRGARPAGPSPQPADGPVRVQRRASNSGVIMVVGQKVALGRVDIHQRGVQLGERLAPTDAVQQRLPRTVSLPVVAP